MAAFEWPYYIAPGFEVFTFADVVYRLMERRGLSATNARELVQVQVSVQDAYRELPLLANWRHYHRRVVVTTEAPQDFTSVTYNASANTLTTSGTWPTNAIYGEIWYGDQHFGVDSRTSSTVLKLSNSDKPSANFTGDVTWIRSKYTLPFEIQRIYSISTEEDLLQLTPLTPGEMTGQKRTLGSGTGDALYYSIDKSQYANLSAIEVWPVPAAATRMEVVVNIRPKPLLNFEKTGTDGATTSGDAVFTSAAGGLLDTMVGSVLRISASSSIPKPPYQYDTARVAVDREVFIRSKDSATQVTTVETASSTVSGKGFTISDYVDIDPTLMLPVLEALAFRKFVQNFAPNNTVIASANAMFMEELNKAKCAMALASHDLRSPATDGGYYDGMPVGDVYPLGES